VANIEGNIVPEAVVGAALLLSGTLAASYFGVLICLPVGFAANLPQLQKGFRIMADA